MAGIITVELTGLRFFAYHGVHEEEAIVGNEFEVDIFIEYSAPEQVIGLLEDTINYAAVYSLIKEEMQVRQSLLETCVMRISDRLHQEYPRIERIKITLRKLQPPIVNFIGTVGVTYTKEFN
jgi:7,8-dihydroneopterin aldolase/epimerase/oxygenase